MKIKDTRWKHIDETFIKLQGNTDLDNFLVPRNRTDELHRFQEAVDSGHPYNPLFEFDPVPDVNKKELEAFRNELDDTDPVERIYRAATDYRLMEIKAAETHSAMDISGMSLALYGKPTESEVKDAWNTLHSLQSGQDAYSGQVSGKIYNAEELAEICRKAMKEYGFDWTVRVLPDMGAKAAVDNLQREFQIRSDIHFHESLVEMLIVHEIGTHVLRSENGRHQPLALFGRGLPGYQYTEEGLAEYAEDRSGVLSPETLYRISGRLIAADIALKGTFWDIYNALKDHFSTDMIFDIGLRVKLGIADTSQPGSYTKDYSYLSGLNAVKRFFKDESHERAENIFLGKIGFQHLDTSISLLKAGYFVKPQALPKWFRNDSNLT